MSCVRIESPYRELIRNVCICPGPELQLSTSTQTSVTISLCTVFTSCFVQSLHRCLACRQCPVFRQLLTSPKFCNIVTAAADNYFYPAWAYVFPTTVLRLPYSLLIATLWACVVYYEVDLAPEASRYMSAVSMCFVNHALMHSMATLCCHSHSRKHLQATEQFASVSQPT